MSAEHRKAWHLRRLDLFASMNDEDVERLAALLDDHLVPAGTELLKDLRRERLFLVKRGVVRLYERRDRHEVTVALLGPGRMFGLSSTFGNDASNAGATTIAESYICFTTWPKLMEVLAGHPDVVTQMMRGLAEQVFKAETWLARFSNRNPRARLADLLLELGEEFGEATSDGCRIRFRLTQSDLGSMIGASRETVSRVMSEFQALDLVSRQHGLIVVRDSKRLAVESGAADVPEA
jgi:CRP/FNR family transcriptional regulator